MRLPPAHSCLTLYTPALEGNHGEVRWNPETHLPEGPITLLRGEDMMSHRLDIPEATFQRAGGSKRRRSRDAACEFHRLDGAAHRVGHRRAGGPPSAPASGSRRRGISATLRSGCREATSALSAGSLPLGPAGLGPTPVPSAGRSMPPESWSGRVRSPRRALVAPPPASASGYRTPPRPRPGVDTAGPDSAIRARSPAPSGRSWTWARTRRSPRCRCCPCPASP